MRNRRMKMKNASLKRKLQTVFATVLPAVMITVSSMGVYAATAYQPWSETNKMPDTPGSYSLQNDVTPTYSGWSVPDGTVNLDLNGKTFNGYPSTDSSDTLNIYDNKGGGKIYYGGGGGALYGGGGTINVYGGTVEAGPGSGITNGSPNVNLYDGTFLTSEENPNGFLASSANNVTIYGGKYNFDPITDGNATLAPGATYTIISAAPAPAAEPQVEADSHVHSYEWVSVKGATDGEDEVMQYRCSCGDVKQEMKVANSAFNNFNQSTANQISKAAAGSTVRVEMGSFTAIHQMIFDAMRQRTDVNVDFIFRNEGHMYSLSVPGGANLSTLPGGAAYTNTESCGCEGIYYVAQQTKTVPAPLN